MEFVEVTYFGQMLWLPSAPAYDWARAALARNRLERRTFAALAKYLDKRTDYIDIGGWIGALAFWAERYAKSVTIVEPDPVSYQILLEGARKNGSKAKIINAALSPEDRVTLRTHCAFGSSESSILIGDEGSVVVPTVKIRDLLGRDQAFLKIDIEGYEYFLGSELGAFDDARIKGVHLSLHPQILRRTLRGSVLKRNAEVAAKTWRMRNLSPRLRLSRIAYFNFAYHCLRRCLLRNEPSGRDLLFGGVSDLTGNIPRCSSVALPDN